MPTEDPNATAHRSDGDSSPLDRPLNGTYVRILIIEAVVLVLLFMLGVVYR
jgi:hypothetical protein